MEMNKKAREVTPPIELNRLGREIIAFAIVGYGPDIKRHFGTTDEVLHDLIEAVHCPDQDVIVADSGIWSDEVTP